MKTRWLLGIVVLIAAMLACVTNPLDPDSTTYVEQIKVERLAVNPPSGTGSFTLKVTYQVLIDPVSPWDNELPVREIHCNYITPDIVTMEIGTFTDDHDYGEDEGTWFWASRELNFNVRRPDGSVLPGTYLAGCSTLFNTTPVTTTFTVTGNDTPTPEPPSQPAATPTATLLAATLKGRIVFHYDSSQSCRVCMGGDLDRVTKWCIPEVTITPDGVVGGTCEFFGTADMHESTVTALVTGIAVQGGSFNFTYVVTEKGSNGWNLKPGENPSVPVWSNEAKWEISYTGSGNFTSATQASGTATFDFSCDSGADNLFWCNSQPREAFSGTVVWSFVPMP